MLGLGPIAFAQPWILLALLSLPALWLLLRVMPPAPKRITFPALRLLLGLKPAEETPSRTPWWLLLLRMVIAALVILALARPLLNPEQVVGGDGPVLIVIDDGWSAAPSWQDQIEKAREIVKAAARQERDVAIATTAPDPLTAPSQPLVFERALEAEARLLSLEPKPWPADRAALRERLEASDLRRPLQTLWLADGMAGGPLGELLGDLASLGALTYYRPPESELPRIVLPPESEGLTLRLRAERPIGGFAEEVDILAVGEDGRLVAQEKLFFPSGERLGGAEVTLPIELRNRIARLELQGTAGAGAVFLLDESSRRRPAGLVASGPLEEAQPLLSELYYIERAIQPYTEVSRGTLAELMALDLSIMVLPDLGALPELEVRRLTDWVEEGGLLLRFAGPRLAEAEDDLLPVRLRLGGRTLGGALTWDEPARLAPFPENSPFAGLQLPEDVEIGRQVLAEPTLDLAERTWALLTDGTPLVTAAPRGEGWVVLVHTTANTDWSNLPLSGLFVEMLQRTIEASQGLGRRGPGEGALAPQSLLDGFGRLGAPPPTALALDQRAVESGEVGPLHPPGYYGSDLRRYAHNLIDGAREFEAAGDPPLGIEARSYAGSSEKDIAPWILSAVLLLMLLDGLLSLWLRGLLGLPRRTAGRTAAMLLLSAAVLWVEPLRAQQEQEVPAAKAIAATSEVHLAYILTGVPGVDEIARAGLDGLSRVVTRRTAAEPAAPIGVRPGRDELAFYPLLYWAISPEQRDLDSEAAAALNDYMRNGGTLIVDLREPNAGANLFGRGTRASQALQRLTAGLEVPPLVPVDPEHVLTKAFYLLQDFPGRYDSGLLWVEDTEETRNDGVASLIVGNNDWAGAWAVNDLGRPLQVVVPGGERQREIAYRFGVNLVMYALTGNYKADQVHVPFILERLGQ